MNLTAETLLNILDKHRLEIYREQKRNGMIQVYQHIAEEQSIHRRLIATGPTIAIAIESALKVTQ